MAAVPILPVIVQESWAQCENPNCNKWRKLPPGYEVKEDEPWYCYQNPDDRKAACSASEEVNQASLLERSCLCLHADHAHCLVQSLAAGCVHRLPLLPGSLCSKPARCTSLRFFVSNVADWPLLLCF
jgi:hypothetical protein